MNILSSLVPKGDVVFIYDNESLRQVLERMEYHEFSAVPMINRQKKYVGTATEGDTLWGIENQYNLSLREAENIPATSTPRRFDNWPVLANAAMEDLIDEALNQNFVPMVDDQESSIGVITRKDTAKYFCSKLEIQG